MAVMALIVEDHDDARLALKTVLEDIGYGVWEAADGASGIVAATDKVPDVVLLDLMLPDMGGLDVLRQLKRQDSTRSIPVVVVSALGRSDVLRDAVKSGASDYIIKPWSDSDLETVLEWVIKKSGKQAPVRGFRNFGLTPNDFRAGSDGGRPN